MYNYFIYLTSAVKLLFKFVQLSRENLNYIIHVKCTVVVLEYYKCFKTYLENVKVLHQNLSLVLYCLNGFVNYKMS